MCGMVLARTNRRLALTVAFCIGILGGRFSSASQYPSQAPTGLWDGSIQSRAGEVSFIVEVKSQANGLEALLVNATDRQPFSSAGWDGQTLTLRLDYYDGELALHMVSPQRMEGEYSRQTAKGIAHIPVTLVLHQDSPATKPWTGPTLGGDWLLHEAGADVAEKNTLANFQQKKTAAADGNVAVIGILEPVSGDSGLLHGRVSTDSKGLTHFHLSRFDGIHILAIDGEIAQDGTLHGQIGGLKTASPFTAARIEDTASSSPNALAGNLTKVKIPQERFRFSGIDRTGKKIDQTSADFEGKPMIVDIFGTWCPNCHDEAPLLEQLYRKYQAQGLVIVGLAYEYVDDTARDLHQIAIYREKFSISFPLLLAGSTDEGQMEKTLPQLVNFGAYPTTVFLDRNGRVHAIHAGFAGPSTGNEYQKVQDLMDQLTREIVDSPQ